MSDKRKKKKSTYKKNISRRKAKKTNTKLVYNVWMKSIAFLAGSGLLVLLLSVTYNYLTGRIVLEYLQNIGRSYEFQIKNDTPVDKVIKSFRIVPPEVQNFVFKITENLDVSVDEDGKVSLPGGNMSYIPAAEFKEIDGNRIPANSAFKFRIPPLSSRSWMKPEAIILDVILKTESSNLFLKHVDHLLLWLKIKPPKQHIRYLVIENYWTVTTSSSIDEAIRVFCRDNDVMAKSSICIER